MAPSYTKTTLLTIALLSALAIAHASEVYYKDNSGWVTTDKPCVF